MKNQSAATILFISNSPPYSRGSHSVSHELAMNIMTRGYATLAASQRETRLARLWDMLSTIWRQRHEYQVAHVQVFSGLAFGWAEATSALLQMLGKPYLLTLHGGNLPVFAQRWPRRVARLLNSASHVTTPSHYLFEAMRPYCTKLQVLPNAIEIQAYPYRQRTQPTPQLLWLRAFHEIYNSSMAAQTLAELLPDYPATRLMMYGPDKGDGSRANFIATANRLNVGGHIELAGAVPKAEVPVQMNRGDIFLNTTNIDNTPSSVIEAMACGLCVVSTNVGGIPFLLEHEHDALLVPPGDAKAMAQAVKRLLHEPGLAARLSANARRKVELFDWAYVLPQWERLFKQALAGDQTSEIPDSAVKTQL